MGAPLFIVSTPQLVIAQCKAGVIGAMPALNARSAAQLEEWLIENGNYLAPSILAAGMDSQNLPQGDLKTMDFGTGDGAKAWKDIWGAGQGSGAVTEVASAAAFIEKLKRECQQAR